MATTESKKDTATKEEYLQLHRWMCIAKALDDRMHILVKQGRAPFVGSSRGHEGIQVASTAALEASDWLACSTCWAAGTESSALSSPTP